MQVERPHPNRSWHEVTVHVGYLRIRERNGGTIEWAQTWWHPVLTPLLIFLGIAGAVLIVVLLRASSNFEWRVIVGFVGGIGLLACWLAILIPPVAARFRQPVIRVRPGDVVELPRNKRVVARGDIIGLETHVYRRSSERSHPRVFRSGVAIIGVSTASGEEWIPVASTDRVLGGGSVRDAAASLGFTYRFVDLGVAELDQVRW